MRDGTEFSQFLRVFLPTVLNCNDLVNVSTVGCRNTIRHCIEFCMIFRVFFLILLSPLKFFNM